MSLSQPPGRGTSTATDDESSPTDEVLALLDDDYSRAILETLHAEASPARDLVDACDASRATVYRRLNRLEDAGLVRSRLAYDPDGHHRTVFEAALDTVTVDLDEDGLALTVSTAEGASGRIAGD
jgi:DNA-binding transcriptional ArsR family regulator